LNKEVSSSLTVVESQKKNHYGEKYFDWQKNIGSFGGVAAFKAAIELNPNSAQAHNDLGRLYYEMGNIREAMRCFTNAFSLNPADHKTVSNICRLYKAMGWTKEAEVLMQKCLHRQSPSPGVPQMSQEHIEPTTDRANHKPQLSTGRPLPIANTKNDKSLEVRVIGSEYGRCAVVLDLIPFGSTVISAGVGEDISFDLELINSRECNVIGIDPTEKARRYVKKIKNEHFYFMQKALCPQGNKTIRIYKNRNPDHVSDSITPHHHAVSPGEFYEAETISVQDLLQKYNNISLLKMDIEGAEYPVLNSVCKLDIPQIYVAFHGSITNHTISDTTGCIGRLRQMGYVPVHQIGRLDQLIDILFVHQKCLSDKYKVQVNPDRLQTATC